MDINLTVKVNNETYNGSFIKVKDGHPSISWSFNTANIVVANEYTGVIEEVNETYQRYFEIRIGESNANIGSLFFLGNLIQISATESLSQFWVYNGIPLVRGNAYYGQVRVTDNIGNSSSWTPFKFKFNAFSVINSARIVPPNPTINDDLDLEYEYYDPDGDSEGQNLIRWFKNGIHQNAFDNLDKIPSQFMQNKDIWSVDILPFDGLEYGVRYTASSVVVSAVPPTVSSVRILPDSPNENDILRAYCDFDGDFKINESEIRWFVNDMVDRNFDNQEYARIPVVAGDIVRFEIKPNDSTEFYGSLPIEILSSDFIVKNIRVDGRLEPIDISTFKPVLSWEVYRPRNRNNNRLSIKIGTYYGAENIFSQVVQTDDNSYTLPGNLIEKGRDYYVSLSVGDSLNFEKYTVTKFRTSGFRWDDSVNNSIGWTVESTFLVNGTSDFDILKYQVIRMQDGSKFCEIRIHNKKVGFISRTSMYSVEIDTTKSITLTVCGKGNDAKVYLDKNLIIDATGKLDQPSNSKFIEIGSPSQSSDQGDNLSVTYKRVNFTTRGMFDPGGVEFSDVQFYNFFELPYNETLGLSNVVQNGSSIRVFASNPDIETDGGSIYSIQSGSPVYASTVTRTFSPISKINLSPDGKNTVFSHSRGVSIFNSYTISKYNQYHNFVSTIQRTPDQDGWDLVQNIGESNVVYFDANGLNINTLFAQTGELTE